MLQPQSCTDFRQPAPKLTKEQLSMSTMDLYQEHKPAEPLNLADPKNHFGPYAKVRQELDWSYHRLPTKERQLMQDSIVNVALSVPPKVATSSKGCLDTPVVIFTAGGMGAGKSHVLADLLQKHEVRLPQDFVWVDPDRLARKLPERQQYLDNNPDAASALLHHEAGLLQELVSGAAFEQKRSMVIDGSLSDCGWFEEHMKVYRDAGYFLSIVFVFAEEETMISRAANREKATGRHTPDDQIRRSMINSAKNVKQLARCQHVDRVKMVDNSDNDKDTRIVYDSEKDPDWAKGGEPPVDKYAKLPEMNEKEQHDDQPIGIVD